MRNVLFKNAVEKIKTHFIFNNSFPENRADNVEKYGKA
jgi:hypothetical protein